MEAVGILEMEPTDIGSFYEHDLHILHYPDDKWRYVATREDDDGRYREGVIYRHDDGSWGIRINEFYGSEADIGFSKSRWSAGLSIDKPMEYEEARGAAEAWVRGADVEGVFAER